jgi:hypothetical protein
LRALDRLITGKKHVRLLGASSPINQTHRSRIFGLLGGAWGPFLAAAAMVMWVLLAVDRSVLLLARILHNSRNSINAHTQSIFSGLKYLDRSKFYSVCPDTPNKI